MGSNIVFNNVRKVRRERGNTQAELAAAVGVTRQTIISIERDRYIPSLPLALKLARYYRMSTDDLFRIDD